MSTPSSLVDASSSRKPGFGTTDAAMLWGASFFAFAVLVHNADHVRRGADAVSRDVFWAGMSAIVLEVAVVLMAFQRHRLVPSTATLAGFSLAAGYVVVHFLPARSWLSDSFTSAPDVSPLSWIAASIEVVAAVLLGLVGWAVLRRRGGTAVSGGSPVGGRTGQRGLLAALVHPVVAAMVLGNAAVVAISLAQL